MNQKYYTYEKGFMVGFYTIMDFVDKNHISK